MMLDGRAGPRRFAVRPQRGRSLDPRHAVAVPRRGRRRHAARHDLRALARTGLPLRARADGVRGRPRRTHPPPGADGHHPGARRDGRRARLVRGARRRARARAGRPRRPGVSPLCRLPAAGGARGIAPGSLRRALRGRGLLSHRLERAPPRRSVRRVHRPLVERPVPRRRAAPEVARRGGPGCERAGPVRRGPAPRARLLDHGVVGMTHALHERLWQANAALVEACTRHPFVIGLGDGSLDPAAFRSYVAQDAFFLRAFGRAYALAAARACSVEDVVAFHHLLGGVLEELEVHRAYAAELGIDLARVDPLPETRAYTDFLAPTAWTRTRAEIPAAMTPCMRLYAHLGQRLAAGGLPAHRYRRWIEA